MSPAENNEVRLQNNMNSPAIVLAGWTIAQPIIPPKPLVANTTGLGIGATMAAPGVDELSPPILGTTEESEDVAIV